MKEIIKKWYERLGFPAEWDEAFYNILKTKELSPCAVADYDVSEPDKEKNLLMFLYFCEELSEKYKERGIPAEVFDDTVSDVVIWAHVHFDINASVGLTEVNWLYRHFTMRLFRLGRLQFCMAEGALEIHIASGDSITPEKCEESLSLAREFFKKYYPDFSYDKFTCHSWLLDDTLKEFLGETSNIARFMDMFEIKSRDVADDALKYVFRFDAKRENITNFTPKSTLAKKLYDHVLSGKKLYCALGEIKK